jgi:DNA-binding NarL/FixJ family response regulator
VLAALDAGADGYLVKDELGEGLGKALQDVIAGRSPLSSGIGAVLVRHLTGRKPVGHEPAMQIQETTRAPRSSQRGQGARSGELIIGNVELKKAE